MKSDVVQEVELQGYRSGISLSCSRSDTGGIKDRAGCHNGSSY
jgi:hypothetical protein